MYIFGDFLGAVGDYWEQWQNQGTSGGGAVPPPQPSGLAGLFGGNSLLMFAVIGIAVYLLVRK